MRHALVGLVVLACTRASSGPPPVLTTTAERTQYVRTGRYDEAVRLCRDFARAYRDVSCRELGVTGGGRPIVALTIARKPGLPVAYIFNAAFEQKEYMEAYVIEEAARAMLAADPSLQAAFDAALAADPELAKSPRGGSSGSTGGIPRGTSASTCCPCTAPRSRRCSSKRAD